MHQLLRILPILSLSLAMITAVPAAAQTTKRDEKAYRKTSAELRETIWAWDIPHFKDYTIPAAFRTNSSVVLARYTDLSAGSTRSIRRTANITEITRELV